ncbi:MAG: serine/threonine-protein kinase PknK, partial [Anaerolineae bacterium]|nr:serine/threonine-protein kinase PknK [Anaerolineae bacterium]
MTMDLSETLLTPRYRLIEQIGVGSMGIVYRALDRLQQSEIAIKRVFLPAQTLASQSIEPPGSLLREFQILASLRHPNIISVLDYGFDTEGIPYLTMDLLRDAVDIVSAGDQIEGLDSQLQLLRQMLLALSYLHRRGIQHRDLKPSNVLVTPDHTVKLLDFGLAQQDTRSAGVVGTLPYIAPEVLLNGKACAASDLFSVGVIAYELLTGVHPFVAQSVSETVNRILHRAPAVEPLQEFPETLQAVILHLLEKDPRQRYHSAMEVIHALEGISGGTQLRETTAYREEVLYTPAFAGRDKWLRDLKNNLRSLPDGGLTYLVSGVSGIGKSRLLHELRIEAIIQGLTVITASGSEVPHVMDGIWRELLPAMLLLIPVQDAEASVLKPLIPNIEQLLERPVNDAPELEYRKGRERLNKTILAIFQRLETPLLLVVDDLQWVADEELLPLQQLHKAAPDIPLLLVCAYRSDEAPYLYGKLPLAKQIELAPLNREEIQDIVRKVLGERADLN